MITLNEWLVNKNLMLVLKNETGLSVFDDTQVMERLLIHHKGDALLFSKYELLTSDYVGQLIAKLHVSKWRELIVIADNFTPSTALNTGTTKKVTTTQNKATTNDTVNKVSAFNTDELVVNDGSDTVENDTLTSEVLTETNDNATTLTDAFNNLLLTDKQHIIKTVINDIASFITLPIY